MASHHEPLKALAPIDWTDVPHEDLETFVKESFAQAQIVIDSVPCAASASVAAEKPAAATGRARAKTDSAVAYGRVRASSSSSSSSSSPKGTSAAAAGLSARLQREWKEIRTSPKDNPHGISVYKLAGKDGRGAWFARRSVHVGPSFEQWRGGLQREFAESIKVKGPPGSGNIRGIGAERNVEHVHVQGAAQLDVFQLSAQFPGPTAPRDFITLLLTSDFSHPMRDAGQERRPLRGYMVVSKPCVHPGCPPRQGIIRGQYESVEVIREVAVEEEVGSGLDKRSSSSAGLLSGGQRPESATIDRAGARTGDEETEGARAVEWLMITRSDPGGSVPRFLIDKGTPPGIVGDAGKFLDWVTATIAHDGSLRADQVNGDGTDENQGHRSPDVEAVQNHTGATTTTTTTTTTTPPTPHDAQNKETQGPGQGQDADHGDGTPSSTGLYGIITGAFGAASAVAGGLLRSPFSIPLGFASSQGGSTDGHAAGRQEDDDRDAAADADDKSDASSARTFASALERSPTGDTREATTNGDGDGDACTAAAVRISICSDESKPRRGDALERDVQRLLERRQRLDRTHAHFQERMTQMTRQGDKDAAKLRERHDRDMAKQEAKFRREMRKLEEKRQQEARKAEARRRKEAERREKSSLVLELERVRAERDVALGEIALLRGQVGALQAQNTMLVAGLGGREGGGGAVEKGPFHPL